MTDKLDLQSSLQNAHHILNSGKLLEGWYQLENPLAGRIDVVLTWRLSDKSGNLLIETNNNGGSIKMKNFINFLYLKINLNKYLFINL